MMAQKHTHEHDHCHDGSCGSGHEKSHEHMHVSGNGECTCELDAHDHDHEGGCSCGHEHAHALEGTKTYFARLITGIVIFALGYILKSVFELNIWVEFSIFFAAYLVLGFNVLVTAGKNIAKGKVFDENFLMTIATIGAFILGDFAEGTAVMLFYMIGETLSDMAVNKSRKSITKLMDIRPD